MPAGRPQLGKSLTSEYFSVARRRHADTTYVPRRVPRQDRLGANRETRARHERKARTPAGARWTATNLGRAAGGGRAGGQLFTLTIDEVESLGDVEHGAQVFGEDAQQREVRLDPFARLKGSRNSENIAKRSRTDRDRAGGGYVRVSS